MIVDMKELTILCLVSDQKDSLDALHDMGVVHLTHVKSPEGTDLDEARKRLTYVRRALEVLPRKTVSERSGKAGEEVVSAVWDILHERHDLEERLEWLRHEQDRLAPYGSFDPETIRALADRGVTVKLYHASPKAEPQSSDEVVIHELVRDKQGTYFAAVGRGEFDLDADELRLPEMSLDAVTSEIKDIRDRLYTLDEQLAGHGGDYGAVAEIVDEAEERVRYLEAREGMGAMDPVVYLRGYCPEEALDRIRSAAETHGWGLLVDEPSDPDKVPTLIRRPAWVRPVKAVFDMIGIMPGYDEIDVSSAFLVFFSIFYGMLVGDAGYGLIFAILTVAARMKFKNMPKPVFSLLMITSFCTIGWGVLTGTYFGIAELPAPLRQVKIDWLSKDENIMALCFLIGAIHLTLAHGWKALAIGKRLLALAEIGWILVTWGMFFVARLMVLGRDMPAFAAPVLGVGVAAIVLFMTPVPKLKNEWFNHVMLPLDIISDFVDVVSYVRLFAVGMATLAVASAFNDMAIGDGINSIVGGLGAAVVLFIGHTLNIVMAIMGVLVHGLRLNALEFSQHMGITWKGFPYQPFARREREPAAEEVSG